MLENNCLVICTPSERQNLTLFMADRLNGNVSVEDALDLVPPEMASSARQLLYPIEEYLADIMMMPGYTADPRALEVYKQDGVSHVAMIALDHNGPAWRFGGDTFQLGYMVLWSAHRQQYRLIHCSQCAQCMAGWLFDMQEQWGQDHALSGAIQKNGKTYH